MEKEIDVQNVKMSGSNQQKGENVSLPAIVIVYCYFIY